MGPIGKNPGERKCVLFLGGESILCLRRFFVLLILHNSVLFSFQDITVVLAVVVKVKQSHYRAGQAQRVLRKLRFPDFVRTAQDGGKVVSLTYRPSLSPGNAPGTHFC